MNHSPAATLFWGIVLLALFLYYLGAIDHKTKKLVGTILTVIMSIFCFWAFDGLNLLTGKPLGIKLGIDLAGGSSFTVQLKPGTDNKGQPIAVTKADVQHAVGILERRLNPDGGKDLLLAPQGEDKIMVQMPGVKESEINDVRNKLLQVAKLEFRLVDQQTDEHQRQIDAGGPPPIGYVSLPYHEHETADTDPNAPKGKDQAKDKSKLERHILVENSGDLDGTYVTKAFAYPDPQKGYAISLEFNSDGAKLFDQIAERGYHRQLAIVVDGIVISAPVLQTSHFGGKAEISGDFTQASAVGLATALQNPLRNPMEILDEVQVTASYGESTIRQGVWTGVVGSVIVAVFMVLYYRFAGLIALAGLFVDFLIMFGTMALFGFTMTMPGIAGMVLTIGMAVDANVLIYERMREELKEGKSLIGALDTAFQKAFPAIFDAHVTALITSAILFYLATGLVKGFAVTMLVGIVGTLFGALIVTKVIFQWFTDSGKLTSLKVHHLIPDRNYDMLSYAKPFIIGSFGLAILSVGIFAIKGPNAIGIDFRGGAVTRFTMEKPVSDEEINSALAGATMADEKDHAKQVPIGHVFAQRSQTPTGGKLLSVRSEYEARVVVKDTLHAKFPDRLKGGEIQSVGSVVGSDLAWNSTIAYFSAMVVIFLYLVVRYEFAFAVGAIVALFHDCLIVVGLSVAFGQELSVIHIGAVLTVAGYSINDTIIVFDRIREMIRTKPGKIRDIMNEAISITLSRTLLTSLTAFMPMAALFFFGGPAMKEFSLPILIGIIVGTYSSIYIASPIVLWYAKKTGQSLRKQVLDNAAASEALKRASQGGGKSQNRLQDAPEIAHRADDDGQ